MLHLRVIAPVEQRDGVLEVLRRHAGVAHIVVHRGAALDPSGDEITADIARESANDVVDELKALDLRRRGAITLDVVDTVVSNAAYPITPATELLEWRSPAQPKVGGTLVQAEDELASINMAIGASFGGVPSLTATSGPGLALMIEAIGLSVTAEVPVTVVDVMRTGPSTGIATKNEQADLNIALYGMHGDAPHVVVAPNSVSDCAAATQWAVSMAEQLQAPAIVLSSWEPGP